jgi:hypothetical protein
MKYDDASWHYGGDFPKNLKDEAGATHIGMFLTWCLLNGLAGELHVEELSDDLAKLKDREETPGQWFIRNCDEKFTDEDLNEIGNKFTEFYYASDNAPYLGVYESTLGSNVSHLYAVPDTWDSYDKLALKLSLAFKKWSKNS